MNGWNDWWIDGWMDGSVDEWVGFKKTIFSQYIQLELNPLTAGAADSRVFIFLLAN